MNFYSLRWVQEGEYIHVARLVEEEAEYQQNDYRNDISRILQRTKSASPHFIAQFRLDDPHLANHDFPYEQCSICLDDFKLNRRFAKWPCKGQHAFHYDCMLSVLRTGYTCPLCRHPVEAATLPTVQNEFVIIMQIMMSNIFH